MLLPHTISSALASARTADDLQAAAAHRTLRDLPPLRAADDGHDVTIRLARSEDARELDRLAQLDGRGEGWGSTADVLVAESSGAIVAARDLRGRRAAVSDPFRPSAPLLALLDVRARQIAGASRPYTARPVRMSPVLRVGGAR